MKSVHEIIHNQEEHKPGTFLRDVILGGQDGLVNVLGIVLGVSAAGGNIKVLIAASLAAAFAEAVSMAAVAYTSARAEVDHYQKEKEREIYEMDHFPQVETEEIRRIYIAKGFEGQLLEKIVATITANRDNWLETMMKEELGLQKIDAPAVLRTSLIVGVTAVLGSLIPLLPFFLLPKAMALPLSLVVSGFVLFGVGVYEAKIYVGNPIKNGIQMLLIGLGAAVIGFFIGTIFHI